MDLNRDIHPTETAQCIVPWVQPQAHIQPDHSFMRFDVSSDMRTAQKRERWTDLTVKVQSREWKVHRLVLGTCSPVFEAWLDWLESKDSGIHFIYAYSPGANKLSNVKKDSVMSDTAHNLSVKTTHVKRCLVVETFVYHCTTKMCLYNLICSGT